MAKRSKLWAKRFIAWEIDWSKKKWKDNNRLCVWARNPKSFNRCARQWHWTTYATIRKQGIPWKWNEGRHGFHITPGGYVVRYRNSLSQAEIEICNRLHLWIGKTRAPTNGVKEHRLVVAKKYGDLPPNVIVRHLNGNKSDNRPENLVIGNQKENCMDHRSAIVQMFYWRERALIAEKQNTLELVRNALGR